MSRTSQSHAPHYLVVAAGISVACVSALVLNCAGIFFVPVMTSLKISLTSLAVYLTIVSLVMAAALPFWGRLMAKKDVRVLGSVAVLVIGATFFLMSVATSLYHFYLAGVLFGLVMPFFLYLYIPTMINRWFKERVGALIGLCLAFMGIAAVILNPVGGWLISVYGWQMAYRIFGVIALALCLPFMLFAVRNSPSDLGLLRFGEEAKGGDADGAASVAPATNGVSASAAMKSGVFYLVVFFAISFGIVASIFILLPTYAAGLSIGTAAAALGATLASVAMLGQTLGYVGLGILNDKSIPLAITVACVSGLMGLFGLWLGPMFSAATTIILVSGFLFGIFLGSVILEIPLLTGAIFGQRDFSDIYSRISTCQALVGAFGVTIWSLVMTSLGNSGLFAAAIVLVALAFLIGLLSLRIGARLSASVLSGEREA